MDSRTSAEFLLFFFTWNTLLVSRSFVGWLVYSLCVRANVCVYVSRTGCSREILSYRLRYSGPGGHTRISLERLVGTWNTCLGRLRELPST